MHTSHLGEDIITDNRLVGRNGNTRISLHESADVVELVLMDIGLGIKLVLENHLNTRQGGIATSLPQPIHSDMQAFGTTEHRCKRVAHGKVIVVVGMEVEMQIRIALHHLAEILNHLKRVHNTQSIRQHKAFHFSGAQGIHHLIDVFGRVLHTVAPVLEIEIHRDTTRAGIEDSVDNVGNMLLGSLAQLLCAMLERALGEEVHRLASTLHNPVDGLVSIHKSQHLDTVGLANLTGIAANHLHRILLALRYSGRSHLDTIDIDILEESAGNHEFLMRQKRHTAGLLSVAQSAVHYLYKRLNACARPAYLFCASHFSILSLFSSR